MDKESVVAEAGRLLDAAEQAQQWIQRNDERVRACGKSRDEVLAGLRRQARLLRGLRRAAERRMCAGVFGPSQAGKSYLLSSLARDEHKKVMCSFGGRKPCDFLEELNPGGGKESTGLVTRFTMTAPPGITDEAPVHVRLLSESELVKIFANTYFCDYDNKKPAEKKDIRSALDALKGRLNETPAPHVTLDVMEDLREYVTKSFGGKSRAAALEEVYWHDAIEMAPRLSLDDRVQLYGIIWERIDQFNTLFLALLTSLEKLGYASEAFCAMEALTPREASIIDVDTLGRTDFSELPDVRNEVQVRTRDGRSVAIERKNLCAIVAELTLVMKHKPAPYFDHTDLLDFPGYKARLECSDIHDFLSKGGKDNQAEQFFRRGKVAYLFQRYTAERELTSLLLCVATPDNTQGLPGAVEDWIISTHGQTSQARENAKTALFYILTKSDRHFEKKAGANMDTHWNDVLKGTFLGHFAGIHSQATRWVEAWQGQRPFSNLFMLRNINIEWSSMMDYDSDSQETGVREQVQDYLDSMRNAFLKSSLVEKHFESPQTAFDELMKLNDGGIEHIKRRLQPLCDPNLKLGQIVNALHEVRQSLESSLAPFYQSGDKEEELRKKKALLGAIGKLSQNPNFQERFPELISRFKIEPEKLFFLFSEAERRMDEYLETAFALPEKEEDLVFDLDAVPEGDPLAFLDGPAAPEPGQAAPSEKDVHHFYASRIIEKWGSNMRDLAETPDCTAYYLFPKNILHAVLDELDTAVVRLKLREKLEAKFREIARPVDVPQESKIRKQASYAIGVLSDFVSWLGKKPGGNGERGGVVKYLGKDVPVFVRKKPPFGTVPVLSEVAESFARQWYKDWLMTFSALMEDNVTSSEGIRINIEENSALGKILQQIKGNQA